MGTNELYAATTPKNSGKWNRRFSVTALSLALALLALGATAFWLARRAQQQPPHIAPQAAATETATDPASAPLWNIEGELTEACTCAVPCTCNFGAGPSPHSYCYPFYSYQITKGHHGDVNLEGLHFGAADLKSGRTIFIDERANERQREALRLIAARVISHYPADEAEAKARELAPGIRYAAVTQEFGNGRNRLAVAGLGEFAADYIMGLDRTEPVVVRNNTTWRVREVIKAKTTAFKVKIGRDTIDVRDTNSNQGAFNYTDRMDFGGPAQWNCGACANDKAHSSHNSASPQSCASGMK